MVRISTVTHLRVDLFCEIIFMELCMLLIATNIFLEKEIIFTELYIVTNIFLGEYKYFSWRMRVLHALCKLRSTYALSV